MMALDYTLLGTAKGIITETESETQTEAPLPKHNSACFQRQSFHFLLSDKR